MNDTDTLIKNRDIAVDSGGRYVHISGDEEILQKAYISICARLGGFVYNRELGCELCAADFADENFAEKLNLIMAQALADYPKVKAGNPILSTTGKNAPAAIRLMLQHTALSGW